MSEAYRLTCGCGETLEVSVTQAGSVEVCRRCGERVEVPTMRRLRELPRVEPGQTQAAVHAETSSWTQGQGLLFISGLVLVAAFSVAVVLLVRERATLQTDPPTLAELLPNADTRNLTPMQVWNAWVVFRDEKLAARETPYFLQQRAEYRRLTLWIIACGVAAAGGLGMAGASVVLGRSHRRQPAGRRQTAGVS